MTTDVLEIVVVRAHDSEKPVLRDETHVCTQNRRRMTCTLLLILDTLVSNSRKVAAFLDTIGFSFLLFATSNLIRGLRTASIPAATEVTCSISRTFHRDSAHQRCMGSSSMLAC